MGWQWNANPAENWVDSSVNTHLRLNAISSSINLWESGNILAQKLPGMTFDATTKLSLNPIRVGERAGLVVFGYSYAWIGLENTIDGIRLVQVTRHDANKGGSETILTAPVKVEGPVYLRAQFKPVTMTEPEPAYPAIFDAMLRSTNALVSFSYSFDGINYTPIGPQFLTKQGRWIGTKMGIFAQAASGTPAFTATTVGSADFYQFSVK